MKSHYLFSLLFFFQLCLGSVVFGQTGSSQPNSTRIEELTGLKGKMDTNEGVFKVSFPRSDLKVQASGARITPAVGITAWAAFKNVGDQSMVMGDIVLTENQVSSVMDAALNNGLEVTALHNHFLWETPRVMFMHIGGMGPEEKLAKAVGEVFSTLKATIKKANPPPKTNAKIDPKNSKLNGNEISEIVGTPGELNDGVFKITIGRTAKMHGHDVGKSMGVNTWAAFSGTDKEAIVAGDFAMLEEELQDVLKALRSSGVHVVAIHNHMTMEKPRYMFLHYWGIGPSKQLAQAIRKALDVQKH